MTGAGGAAVDEVLRLVAERAGLTFRADQRDLVESVVRRRMEAAGVPSTARFVRLAATDRSVFDSILEELTVGETYFFRHGEQLDVIRERVLPELLRHTSGAGVRCWSAACASGEEAYTLSVLLRQGAPGEEYRVLGTDVVRSRLAAARAARYGPWSLRGVPAETVARWFEPRDGRYEVRREVRYPVEFRELNLAAPAGAYVAAGAWGMDLVLCRNVLIYMDEATTRHVAERLVESLSPAGWLFLGASDPPLAELVPCEVVETEAGLAYRRRARRSPAPAGAGVTHRAVARPAPVPLPAPPPPPAANPAGPVDAALEVRALADAGRTAEAADACIAALDRNGASPELLYLHAVLLLEGRRPREAAASARRALYLDRGMIVAHLALGSALAQAGDAGAARRALRGAAALLEELPPGAEVPASGGETAARLLAGVRAQLHALGEEVA